MMSKFKYIIIVAFFAFANCDSIRVITDYDKSVDFSKYKTFAFYKPAIDKAEISDLDKKRILYAIENQLVAQGYVKSDNPDFLVGIFTKARERVNVNQNNFGWGWGWGFGWDPWMWNGGFNNLNVSQYTEGTLFIDFIDKNNKDLIWQGVGSGALRLENMEKKEARINEFVKEIILQFPPQK